MERIKRRDVSCGEEDRISHLPEHLKDLILERLPIEEAVRTSIISKKWRYRWTTMSVLVFDLQFSKKFSKNGAFGRNGFIRIINKFLILHTGPISKFLLHIPNIFLDTFEEVDQWMLLLSRRGVRELILANSNRSYELPSCVFSCLELRSLKMVNCFFNPPRAFEGFLNLEELLLHHSDFGGRLCGTKINLPRLKRLALVTCTNVYNFNINATKLQTLIVLDCPDAMLLRLLDSPCLFQAIIALQKPIQDFVRVEKITLATLMLNNLPSVRQFCIDSHFLKVPRVIDVGPASNHLESPNCFDCTLNQLQTVEITCLEGSKPELLFIKLLAPSPSLDKLTITPSQKTDAQKRFDITTVVIQFPRASSKAKMFYLNPKP